MKPVRITSQKYKTEFKKKIRIGFKVEWLLKYISADTLIFKGNTLFSVTTIYPVAELSIKPLESDVSEDIITQATEEDGVPTEGFFPTMAAVENSLETFTIKPETPTFVPFIPNVLPEATSGVSEETPAMASVEEESAEDTLEEDNNVMPPVTTMTTNIEQGEETVAEVEDILPTEQDGGHEPEAEEPVTEGKATFGLIYTQKFKIVSLKSDKILALLASRLHCVRLYNHDPDPTLTLIPTINLTPFLHLTPILTLFLNIKVPTFTPYAIYSSRRDLARFLVCYSLALLLPHQYNWGWMGICFRNSNCQKCICENVNSNSFSPK